MPFPTSNPTVNQQQNLGAPHIYYLADGTAIFCVVATPEGSVAANPGSMAIGVLGSAVEGKWYRKNANTDNTGWVDMTSGGGGSGTVTDFSAGNLSPLFTTNVATSTTTPALTFTQVSQLQNLVFASPNGSSGNPTFRALVAADIPNLPFSKITTGIVPVSQGGTGQDFSAVTTGQIIIGSGAGTFTITALVASPTNALQYNGGGGLLAASAEIKVDPLTATLQLGAAAGNRGQIQLFGATANHFFIRPADNGAVQSWVLPDALPADNTRFLKVASIAGAITTLEYAVPSGAAVADNTGTIGLSRVNGVAATAMRSDGTPPLSQAIAPTWSAQHIFNANGAASTPPVLINGTVFSGGSSTTTKPQLFVEPNGTTSTTWNTNGTLIGANAASGFSGNLIDLKTNNSASQRFHVTSAGQVCINGSQGLDFVNGSNSCYITGAANSLTISTNGSTEQFNLTNAVLGLGSAIHFAYSSTTTGTGSKDVGFIRSAAGSLRISNGSTGIGSLLIAQNGVSALANLHVEPTATGTKPYYSNSPSGASVSLIQCQVNTSDRFVVSQTGKVTGNQNNVASVRMCGQYVADVSDHNNGTTVKTDLFTNTLPANLLGTNLDCLQASFTLICASNANGKQITVEFGSTILFDTGAQAYNGTQINLECKIYRVSATVQRCVVTYQDSDGTLGGGAVVTYTAAAEDLTTALVIKTTGDGGATNDITNKVALIVINPN